MSIQRVICPHCSEARYVIKCGRNKSGSQRHRCRRCRRYFTMRQNQQGYDPEKRDRALQLRQRGISLRAIGRILQVNHQTVSNWIKAARKC